MGIRFRDYFLHFLDRELLETQGAYDKLLEEAINRDVRFIILNSTGDLILSASFLFESKYAYAVFNEFYSFFIGGKFTIAITYDNIKKMISIKQDQYRGKEKFFPNYFNDLWHVLEESGVIFVPKKEDTTIYIATSMLRILQQDKRIIETESIPYIKETIEDRGKKAITHHLFDTVYEKRNISSDDQEKVNALITESYIRSYMDYFDATVPMGLSCGIYTYDYLSDGFPLSDVSFWIKLYKKIGLYRFVCSCSIKILQAITESPDHQKFLNAVEKWISTYEQENEKIIKNYSFYKIINLLSQHSELLGESFNSYIGRIKSVTLEIQELAMGRNEEKKIMKDKEKTVFVVHGRNQKIKQALFNFLRALNIKPLEWESAVKLTNKGAPTTLEVIKAGMENAKGVIILFTGDDLAKLKEEFWEEGEVYDYEQQPRQNVLIEAGMAMALYPNSTIIVRIGKLREISDFAGVNYVNLNNKAERRQAFVSRLKTIGVEIDDSGSDWLSIGDFEE